LEKLNVAPRAQSVAMQIEKDLDVIFIVEASYVVFPLSDRGLTPGLDIACPHRAIVSFTVCAKGGARTHPFSRGELLAVDGTEMG
jgi:hypothetical protein